MELRQLQQRLEITTIVVTHDQREAMTMSDQIVVMSNGKVEQMAAPIEAYRRPATPFVADFLGQANLIQVEAAEGGARFAGGRIDGLDIRAGAGALISIRPEDILVSASQEGAIKAEVVFVREMGAITEIHLDAGGERIVVHAAPNTNADVRVGATVFLTMPAEACVVFDGAEA